MMFMLIMLMLMMLVTYSLSVDGVKRKENRCNESGTRGHVQAPPVVKIFTFLSLNKCFLAWKCDASRE